MSDPFVGQIQPLSFAWVPYGWASANGALINVGQQQALFSLIGNKYGGDGTATFAVPNLNGRVAIGYSNGGTLTPPGVTTVYQWGQYGGHEITQLTASNVPPHLHTATVTTTATTGVTANTTVTPNISGLTATTTLNCLTAPSAKLATPVGNLFTVPTVQGAGTPVQAFAAPGTGTAGVMAPGAASTALTGSITAPATTSVSAQTLVSVAVNVAPNNGGAPFDNRVPFLAINYVIALLGIYPPRN